MKTPSLKGQLATRLLLLMSGMAAMGIAVAILFAPSAFYAANGIEFGGNINLTNELKAPAGVLLAAGLVMLAGVFRTQWITASLVAATAIYLPYGLARLISMAIDGLPHSGLVSAAVFEIAIGAVCLLMLKSVPGSRIALATSRGETI